MKQVDVSRLRVFDRFSKHEDAVVDFDCGTELDVENFHDVRLVQQQKSFAIDKLRNESKVISNFSCDTRSATHLILKYLADFGTAGNFRHETSHFFGSPLEHVGARLVAVD